MYRKLILIAFLILSLVSIAVAQNNPPSIFVPYRQIGSLRPSGIQYDPNFDRLAMVDLQGELVLADALTFQTQNILYKNGSYNAYQFSHDGRYLALAIDKRIELWDTQIGKMSASFEPDGALLVQGPLEFTPDDKLLLLNSVVPAPQATRTSENDTDILPWLWDLTVALREGHSSLPGQAKAYAFFNYRNGLVIGPNRYLVAGLPSRLEVLNGSDPNLPVVSDIDSTRLETDPIDVWQSATSDFLYVDPKEGNDYIQINTRTGKTADVPFGTQLDYTNMTSVQDMQLSSVARVIGQGNTLGTSSLFNLIWGSDSGRMEQGRSTMMLLDILEPMTSQDQSGLLIYDFNNDSGTGILELVHPSDALQMVLSPDHNHLMVRRASGAQPIEIYNITTGVLERSYYPAEPDPDGSHLLAYNADGSAILSDFQRFNVTTGTLLADNPNYTSGFDSYFFTPDSQQLITVRGSQWETWDIATGKVTQTTSMNLQGNIIAQTADSSRFLTRFTNQRGEEVMETLDIRAGTRQDLTIPNLPGTTIENIFPSDDWQNELVVYAAAQGSQDYPGNEIAVYNVQRGKLLFIAGDDLPQPDGRQYGWLDNQTIFVSSTNATGHTQPERVYGVDYAPSGVPECLVQAFPEQWQAWQPVWENLTLNLRADDLDHLTQRMCSALPKSADQVVTALTPTATFAYHADATGIPINIPGVPTCLTQRFQSEAIDYAALWRQMTDGLKDDQIKNLSDMICEGLISSVYGIEPTPTVNPNVYNPPTETPLPDAPSTTDQGSSQQLEVMAINIENGQRSIGAYVPPHGTPDRDISIVTNLFRSMQHFDANNPVLSPDGKLLATADQNGFVDIYQMTRSYDQLLADEANAAATRTAQEPRSIGLIPTATPTFEPVGVAGATLTPTVTTTPPPRVEATAAQDQNGQSAQKMCPATTLYDISNPPPDYAATGRLFVQPPQNGVKMTWVLQPQNGQLNPDDRLPQCGINENCTFSFDHQWILRQNTSVIVSRPDGSSATVLFRPDEAPLWPQMNWVNLHTLRFSYQGYLPDKYNHLVALWRQFDPISGTLSDPFEPPAPVSVNGLPTLIISTQPGAETLDLVTTPYAQGAKYYIYDRQTGKADYFARTDNGPLNTVWHPLGRYLYYQYPDQPTWYVFDTQTRQQAVLGDSLPAQNGTWSPDGRYSINWFNLPADEADQRYAAGERLPKINIWDSQTGQNRRYCFPETSRSTFDGTAFIWSPDGRYVAFTILLPPQGDVFPVATTTPDLELPTATALPLETQYQYQKPRTIVLDTQTGTMTVISKEVPNLILWTDDGGAK